MSALQVAWFFLIGVLITGYAILDGFDLGVGFWQLFNKGEKNRRIFLNAIGPVWDGNEVWLLTGGGAIFAAFPAVYASVFSGFYLALLLVLTGLIARAVSIEFRHQVKSPAWRSGWDLAFGLGSTLPALLFGVALGNVMRGIPLNTNGDFTGTFFSLLNPYALLIGLVGLAMIATHGALFLVLKTEGELAERARRWAGASWIVYLVLFLLAFVATLLGQPHLTANFQAAPALWLVPALALASIIALRVFNARGKAYSAFVASSVSIAALMGIVGASIFPNMVRATNDPSLSLTVGNASSSQLTLKVLLILALAGMPVVIGYTIWVYRMFRGKVRLEQSIY